jgi:alpha-glucoside transport system substrate-binding protein
MRAQTRGAMLLLLGAAATLGTILSGCSATPPDPTAAATGVVTIEGPIIAGDAALLTKSWSAWAVANHITIKYTGSANFEEQIATEAQQGNAPDLAIFAQPGLVRDLASRGYLKKLPTSVVATAKSTFPSSWINYTTFGGAEYAAPLLANVHGWVFYSPKQFAKWGVSPPPTWFDLQLLTQRIKSLSGTAPWCDGFSAGAASGEAGTDWIEDLVLRDDGPDVYDQWVAHEIPFSDPRIQRAFSDAAQILQSPNYVNAGIGGSQSIDTTTTAGVATALESGTCAMTHEPSSFVGDLRGGDGSPAAVGPNGDFWAFPLPPVSATTVPLTGGGEFTAAFSNDSDTVRVQNYLASSAWAMSRVALGGVISPDVNVKPGTASSTLLQLSANLLDDPQTVFRFDGSDLMPSVVGSGAFLTGMVDWIDGEPTSKVVTSIDAAWPRK